jgi:hypothetical protein
VEGLAGIPAAGFWAAWAAAVAGRASPYAEAIGLFSQGSDGAVDSTVVVGGGRYPLGMATRERVNVDLDAEVAAILRKHAAEAHVSEGEILDRAVRAYDLRGLLARLQANSDLDEDQAMALAREELKAARAARRGAG